MSNDEKKKARDTLSKQKLNELKKIEYCMPALEEMRHSEFKKSYSAKQLNQMSQPSNQTHPTKKDEE